MEFKIIIPKNPPIKKEEIINQNKKMFADDFQKEGVLAKTLVFTKMNEPIQCTDLKEIFQGYYQIEFDINVIKRALKRLNDLGILHSITSGELMTISPNQMNDFFKEAYRKFFLYLEHIPKQFRKQYTHVTYFWVSNGEGNNYLEWCCKLLGFEIKKEDDKNAKV